ncbi:uncharacterized protein LOC121085612 [Falco naumanni]|uniref:uncharacterized protein LOC121085612 n=1 Tax=Falco naumanni TaxID=148594 RepID=UPI001ADDF263|nr:uncharacterized protein LOC121085612 [Falco naumanni]
MDLMALEACKAADRAKKDANRTRSRILAERARMYRSRATQEVSVDTGWRKDVYQRHLRAQERHELTVDSPTPASQDQLVGTRLEAVRSQMEHEARVTQKTEQAKAARQCSRIWDIPGRLLEQQKSSADLEQCIREGEEKKQALAERLHEPELKLAKLKFHQPSNISRCAVVSTGPRPLAGGGHVCARCPDTAGHPFPRPTAAAHPSCAARFSEQGAPAGKNRQQPAG